MSLRSSTAIRHPAHLMHEARQLRADHKMSTRRIADELRERHGLASLSPKTVLRWVSPEYADKQNVQNVQARRRRDSAGWTFGLGGCAPTPEYQAAFVRRLRDDEIPAQSVLKVFRIVFADQHSSDRAIYRLIKEQDNQRARAAGASTKETHR